MAEAFKIGEGYVEITSRVDRDGIARDAERAGDDAGDAFGDKFDRAANEGAQRAGREHADKFHDGTTVPIRNAGREAGNDWAEEFEKALKGPRKNKKKGDGPKHGNDDSGFLSGFTDMLKKSLKAVFSPSTTMMFVKGLGAVLLSPPVITTVVAGAAALGTLIVSGLSAALLAGIPMLFGGGLLAIGLDYINKDPAVAKQLKKLGKSWWKMMDTVTKPLIKPWIAALKIIDSTMAMMTPTLTAMGTILGRALVPLAEGFKGFFANLAPGLLVLTGMSTDALTQLGGWLPTFGTMLSNFFIKIQQNWPGIKKSFGEFFTDFGTVVGAIAKALFWLATNYEKIKTVMSKILGISNPIVAAAVAIYKIFKWLYDVLVGHSIIPDLVNGIIRWFAKLPGKLVGYVANLVPRVIAWFARMASQAISWASRTVTQVIAWFAKLPGRAASAVSRLWSSMSGAFSSAASNARAKAVQLVSRFIDYLRTLPDKARTQAGRVRGAITGAFGNAGGWLVSAGRRIISGLISGIRGMIGSLRNTLGGITGMIPDWKGPAERDAKLLRPAGQLVMDGFMGGVESRVNALRRQLGGITAGMPDMAIAGAPSSRSGAAPAAGGGLTIGNLTINLKGVWNENDPVAHRALVLKLQTALSEVERSRRKGR